MPVAPLPPPPSPSRPTTAGGAERRVGVEVEFIGLGVRHAAEVLQRHLAGQMVEEDPQAFHLVGSRLGDLRVELDIRHVHPHRGAVSPLAGLPASLSIALGHALAPMVPRELIIAPLDRARLPEVDAAVAVLREAGARGDGATLVDGLGLHFNVAHPDDDPAGIVATLKAFLTLEPELRRATEAGPLARFYAPPPFPDEYVRRVLADDYWPDPDGFARDYLAANPTRKRSLDLLPLLLHRAAGQPLPRFAGKVRPRPAFHYRLPPARVGQRGWSILDDWERWLAVERLAGELARQRPPAADRAG